MRALRLVTVAALAAGVVAPLGGAQAAPPVPPPPPVYLLCKPALYPWDVLYPVAHVTLVRPGLVC